MYTPASSCRSAVRNWLRALACAALLHTATATAAPFELLVPAYFYPAGKGLTYWNDVAAAAVKVPITAVLNPNSGPGASIDPSYTNVVSIARAAGVRVIGYVHTSYAARPLADVFADIDRYRAFYPVDGFFIDETTNNDLPANVDYYAAVYRHIKALDATLHVVVNPGTQTPEIYASLPAADAVVTFESGPREYRRYQASPWVGAYGSERFGHLVHDVGTLSTAKSFLDLAAQRNAGLVYITNDKGAGNPWDSLPSYWSGLVSEICRRNGGSAC